MATRDMPDETRWWRERPTETLEYNRFGVIAGATLEQICDLPAHDVTVQRLVLSTSHRLFELRVYLYLADLTLTDELQILERTGTTKHHVTPDTIYTYTSDLFDMLEYNLVDSAFKFCLVRPFRCAHGVRVEIYNFSGFAENCALEMSILDRGIIP